MSDLLGILVVGGRALHLVDWDRPVWLDPEDPNGLRITPSPDYFVADAIAVFKLHALDRCGGDCRRSPGDYNDLSEAAPCLHLVDARDRAYANTQPVAIFIHAGPTPDVLVSADLLRLKAPHVALRATDQATLTLGLS